VCEPVTDLQQSVRRLAEEKGFSGVVRVDRAGETEFAEAFGMAERGFGIPNRVETRFGLASGTKGFTALTVMSLVTAGQLGRETLVREVLGEDLPEIDDRVSVWHLLAHRSGIGDYVDEDSDLDLDDYLMPRPVHELATTEGYLPVLTGHPQRFAPGERFAYCNSGYVVLALVAERVAGVAFHELVERHVTGPAGMADTAFLRSDELPGTAARGYLGSDPDGLRTNVLHLPVRGSGDGGVYSTVADVHRLWSALDAGAIVGTEVVEEMQRPYSDVPKERRRYGLGFWLHAHRDVAMLEGLDAGVSFQTMHDRGSGTTFTVISNTANGAWRLAGWLRETLVD
jgi:CubicO group peptidase (beta-lactamase class C family)